MVQWSRGACSWSRSCSPKLTPQAFHSLWLMYLLLSGVNAEYIACLLWCIASLIAQLVKNPPAMQETSFNSWVRKIPWRRDRLPTPVFLGFPCGSAGKESACNVGDLGSIPELGRSPGEGKGYPLQYFDLQNFMDYIIHGVTKSRI